MPHEWDGLIDITIPGCADDPRARRPDPPGVRIHRVPELHPDDVTVIDGIPVTTVSRTLIDLADDTSPRELRALFTRARAMGLLDLDAVEASFARVEWRPSRVLLRKVIDEFHALEEADGR